MGSTKERTIPYQRILKTYLDTFGKEFIISALAGPESNPKEVLFAPDNKEI